MGDVLRRRAGERCTLAAGVRCNPCVIVGPIADVVAAQAIIYVLDSTDKVRMCVAKDELEHMLSHKSIKDERIPILFFANKMDKASALTPAECMDELGLSAITDKAWHIAASCATTGEGVEEGIEWLATHVAKKDRK